MRKMLLIGTLAAVFGMGTVVAQKSDRQPKRTNTSRSKNQPRNQEQARRRTRERDVARLLQRFDKNNDGLLAGSELPEAQKRSFARMDTNRDEKLSKSELLVQRSRQGRRIGEIVTGPARGERHSDRLKLGDPAPDFTLADPSGKHSVTLSSFQGKKPVVLIFGSYT